METVRDALVDYIKANFNTEKDTLLNDNGYDMSSNLPDIEDKDILNYHPINWLKYPAIFITSLNQAPTPFNIGNDNGRVRYDYTYNFRIYILNENNKGDGDLLDRQIYRYTKALTGIINDVDAFRIAGCYKNEIKSIDYVDTTRNKVWYFKVAVIDVEYYKN